MTSFFYKKLGVVFALPSLRHTSLIVLELKKVTKNLDLDRLLAILLMLPNGLVSVWAYSILIIRIDGIDRFASAIGGPIEVQNILATVSHGNPVDLGDISMHRADLQDSLGDLGSTSRAARHVSFTNLLRPTFSSPLAR